MHRIYEDFITRRWPLLIMLALLAVFPRSDEARVGLFFFSAVLGMVLLEHEENGGLHNVHATLPVLRKRLSVLYWIQAVLLFPLLCAAVQIAAQYYWNNSAPPFPGESPHGYRLIARLAYLAMVKLGSGLEL